MSFNEFLFQALGMSLFSKASQGFFRELVSSTMQEREAKSIFRPDMIHLLMEAKKGKEMRPKIYGLDKNF